MKKVFIIISSLIIFGCAKDKCKDVKCENGNPCVEGQCQCAKGYSGSKCENIDVPYLLINKMWKPSYGIVNGTTIYGYDPDRANNRFKFLSTSDYIVTDIKTNEILETGKWTYDVATRKLSFISSLSGIVIYLSNSQLRIDASEWMQDSFPSGTVIMGFVAD